MNIKCVNKYKVIFIILLLLLSSLFVLELIIRKVNKGSVESSEVISFQPIESNSILVNPYMGPAPRATNTNPAVTPSLVFNYVSWKELEPTKGVIDFATFESKNNLSYWASRNIKFIFRIHMDYPGTTAHHDIPDWLYNEIGADGTVYNKSSDGSYGMGFSPNYDNPKLIAYHRELIRKLGERYNNDPRIAFVELGSVGHWAEWHTYSGSKLVIPFPRIAVTDQYIQPYIDYFSNKKLLIRRPFQIAKDNNMGLFNDEYGNYNQTYTWWLNWINNGYNTAKNNEHVDSMSNYWMNNTVGGENTMGNAVAMGSSFPAVLKAAKDIHLSYTKSAWSLSDSSTKSNAELFYKTIGYRFVVQSVSIGNNLKPGELTNVTIEINNKGVAPFYYNWPVELSLVNSNGSLVYRTNISENVRTWMPGVKSFTTSFAVPSSLQAGTYTLGIAIIDPEKNLPGIYFANEGRMSDGRYSLGKINIVTSPVVVAPTAVPTVKPTLVPTVAPTIKPTVAPTIRPTATPTTRPTAIPTIKPTATPTVSPSQNFTISVYGCDTMRLYSGISNCKFSNVVRDGAGKVISTSVIYSIDGNPAGLSVSNTGIVYLNPDLIKVSSFVLRVRLSTNTNITTTKSVTVLGVVVPTATPTLKPTPTPTISPLQNASVTLYGCSSMEVYKGTSNCQFSSVVRDATGKTINTPVTYSIDGNPAGLKVSSSGLVYLNPSQIKVTSFVLRARVSANLSVTTTRTVSIIGVVSTTDDSSVANLAVEKPSIVSNVVSLIFPPKTETSISSKSNVIGTNTMETSVVTSNTVVETQVKQSSVNISSKIKSANSTFLVKNASLIKKMHLNFLIDSLENIADINLDGIMDQDDYQLLEYFLVGKIYLSDRQVEIADLNKDGTVNSADLILLRGLI